jgi:hypothetical protein
VESQAVHKLSKQKQDVVISQKKKPMAEFEKFGLLIPHVLTQ